MTQVVQRALAAGGKVTITRSVEKRTKKLKVECTVKGTTTGKEAKWTDGSDLEVTIERALLEESTLDRDALVSSVLSTNARCDALAFAKARAARSASLSSLVDACISKRFAYF